MTKELENLLTTFLYSGSSQTNYPPYNIIKTTYIPSMDTSFEDTKEKEAVELELAVAGFKRNDLKVTLHNQSLSIEGDRKEEEKEYIHKGISSRKFAKTFTLGKFAKLGPVSLRDGMLKIIIYNNIPEEELPKEIQIQ